MAGSSDRTASGSAPDGARTDALRARFVVAFSAVGVVSVCVLAAFHAFDGDWLTAGIEAGAGLVAAANAWWLRRGGRIERAVAVVLGLMLALFGYLLVAGGVGNTGILWFFTFPMLAFFLQGARGGWWWMGALFAVIGAMMLAQSHGVVTLAFDWITLRQLVLSLLAVSVLAFLYERIRAADANMIRTQSQQLVDSSDRLIRAMQAQRAAEERDLLERKRIDRLKNEFIATVSHELRTPLTAIRGSLGLLAGDRANGLGADTQRLLDIALRNSDRLTRLVNNILEIERLESGERILHCKPHSIGDLIERATAVEGVFARQLGVALDIDVPEPDLPVTVDAEAAVEALSHLLSNAIKFSPPGERVTLRVEPRGDRVRVEITDRGPGIPAAFQAQIFQKFAVADARDDRQQGGTGLGLCITRQLIEQMGGEIGFDAPPGGPTTFWLTWKRGQSPFCPGND